ncbi:MAG: response regulator [Acidobacteria bacterium]|jgi:signal transduction histidine kinase/ActR/RegA family two-component response regulator|nr:response regulator [Acidobacteriota bacterium]
MSTGQSSRKKLEARLRALEEENARLRAGLFVSSGGDTVRVPEEFRATFDAAQDTVRAYFADVRADPGRGSIEIAGERYLLIRASALSYGFLSAIRKLYAERGDAEALHIGKTILFDMAHVLGINDARNFHRKMGLTDPLAKLSAGPVHFAYAGWAYVDILPGSRPSVDEDCFLKYHHPFSFESHSWLQAGRKTDFPVCIMNAGYSSGWCEESFGLPLTATEITCKAKGDDTCTFVLAPPHRMREHVERELATASDDALRQVIYETPVFFERKNVEERLREALVRAEAANEAKSLFLANMSHEIRTPLTGVLGMSELLMRKDLPADHKRMVRTIHESGRALLGILNDILDISKIEAGRLTVSSAPCDVRAILREIAEALGAPVAEKGLKLAVEVDASVPPRVSGDPLRLRQIVMNLAGNAVKFTEEGGVTLRAVWKDPDSLHLEVADSGIGIAEKKTARLFDPFVQGDGSDTRRFAGAGLGLSIARKLVELMEGEIGVRTRVGEGSTFWFTIPAPRLEGATADEPERVATPLRVQAHVLLVEDDRTSRYVIEKMLAEYGCSVDSVANGREAVAACTTGAYDIVFMDCQMPVMDGYDATARIREVQAGGARTPIIAMTASVMRGQIERCREAGMDDFLGKPLDTEQVGAVLSRWAGARTSE